MIVADTYPVSKILEEINKAYSSNNSHIYLDGYKLKVSENRLRVFVVKGLKCVTCPKEGSIFKVERHKISPPNSWHLNLYAVDANNKHILMTRDHIVAKTNGGNDSLENSQPMCTYCNCKKGTRDRVGHAPESSIGLELRKEDILLLASMLDEAQKNKLESKGSFDPFEFSFLENAKHYYEKEVPYTIGAPRLLQEAMSLRERRFRKVRNILRLKYHQLPEEELKRKDLYALTAIKWRYAVGK